ncbi:GNAT family N-acetyltransferase [Sunxiuqinia elliptica]|uniref:Acetyltransferase (GNAT) domain-containing protein n=1 Tax=Sunxiuqinia elliptica TaxID=655355 RepID=A0A1I2C4Y9_9BACT|nr:GNAT family N-acetyltransferase [Sunxiuqinia elliptica]SFE63389.1 Acetyltransferase (GNAT) domain-containing protein [Sunxiuqinia elliptica]
MLLKKVSIAGLEAFVKGEEYGAFTTKPISEIRAKSYLANPHAQADDVVLYLLIKDNDLIAFRSVVPGYLPDEKVRFAWLSGTWVHPEHRREGYSMQLLNEALTNWNGHLLSTNFAPAAHQLFKKSMHFKKVYQQEGARFYGGAKLSELLGHRFRKLAFLLPLADVAMSVLASLKKQFYQPKEQAGSQLIETEFPDDACYQLAEQLKGGLVFGRGREELEWIFKNPWISKTDDRWLQVYPFSSYAKEFQYFTLKILDGNELKGFMVCLLRDGHLKTVFNHLDEAGYEVVADYLKQLALVRQVQTLTVFDSHLVEALNGGRSPFVFHKKLSQFIYASFPVSCAAKKVQDGDGDFIFT